ncbi:phosphopantothenate--cysteine ligase-like [Centruroides sculpturatus]|uniref:phosphopantothenate--cysteine ligase-like n=1 Tax=Centruroides sculpturatus TaxID=218467 RepID=UPI000C6C8C6C|nr:phosphopantothenate--cysteine ligase-like [Centruroides sculpturatus]
MAESRWEDFYRLNPSPDELPLIKSKICAFCKIHSSEKRKIALITSGGTMVPLEHNTVRFVDNFSAGNRGSASAEYFLKSGYAIIFLYRRKSLQPFARHFPANSMLEILHEVEDDEGNFHIEVISEKVQELLPVLQNYHSAIHSSKLLMITFTTLSESLVQSQPKLQCHQHTLVHVSQLDQREKSQSTHKIHSADGPLNLELHLVPKVLQPLVCHWVPEAYIVSFKLETDESLLLEKANHALERYGHKLVVANALHNRTKKVILVTKDDHSIIELKQEEIENGCEIEEKLVSDIVSRHNLYLAQ